MLGDITLCIPKMTRHLVTIYWSRLYYHGPCIIMDHVHSYLFTYLPRATCIFHFSFSPCAWTQWLTHCRFLVSVCWMNSLEEYEVLVSLNCSEEEMQSHQPQRLTFPSSALLWFCHMAMVISIDDNGSCKLTYLTTVWFGWEHIDLFNLLRYSKDTGLN